MIPRDLGYVGIYVPIMSKNDDDAVGGRGIFIQSKSRIKF